MSTPEGPKDNSYSFPFNASQTIEELLRPLNLNGDSELSVELLDSHLATLFKEIPVHPSGENSEIEVVNSDIYFKLITLLDLAAETYRYAKVHKNFIYLDFLTRNLTTEVSRMATNSSNAMHFHTYARIAFARNLLCLESTKRSRR